MPRDKRLEIPGAVYHVMSRGIERREIFKDDDDREEFLRRFEEGLKKTDYQCYGWVLMPNHFHLLIRTGIKSLSDLMRRLLTGYAVYFNLRHKRSGYLYQNRYKSILCQEDVYLLELVRYIHLNPLRGGLVKNIGELNKFKWSGHSVLVGENRNEWQSINEILEYFSNKKSDAIKKYLDFIKAARWEERRDDLMGGGLVRSAGGWRGVLELKKNKDRWQGDERILGDGDFVSRVLKISEEDIEKRERLKRKGWEGERLIGYVCNLLGLRKEELKKKGKNNKVAQAKGLIAYWGKRELCMQGTDIGKLLGITKQAVSLLVSNGEKFAKENNYILTS